MKYVLNNIDLNKLSNGIVIDIANCMGYPLEMPSPRNNKYLRLSGNIDFELFNKEQEQIDKEYNKAYDLYIDNVYDWLREKGYIKVIKEKPYGQESNAEGYESESAKRQFEHIKEINKDKF